jgi:putative ABC transport system substrate-binding protein
MTPASRADVPEPTPVFTRRPALAVVLASLIAPVPAGSQTPGKVYRLGMLSPGPRPGPSSVMVFNLLPAVLREMGYVEGRNLIIESRFADGNPDRLSAHAQELVRLRVDALLAASPPAVRAAKASTATIPIVMLLAYSDPVELGLVRSYARPGSNVTGVAMAAEPTIVGKRLELIKQVVSQATRVAVLTTNEPQSRAQVLWVEKAAATLGVTLIVVPLQNDDYESVFAAMAAARPDALFVVESTILSASQNRIIQLAAQYRLPAIYDWREYAESGGLMAYGGSLLAFTRRTAAYIDRLFKGASPADLPVERASTFELVINLRTARTLGLTIPKELLAQVDAVIQ